MSGMYIEAACKSCVFFWDGPNECKRYPGEMSTHHTNWCGEFEPKRKHYWWPNGYVSEKPKVLWPGDEDA